MRIALAFTALVLAAAALATIPSASAALPIECVMASCGPQGPSTVCREFSIGTSDFFGYLGPHARVSVHSDCTVDVTESGTVCPELAPDADPVHASAGPAELSASGCRPEVDCTCDPLPIESASSSLQMPYPCQYCDPHCPPIDLGTAWQGPYVDAELTEGCHADVAERGLDCQPWLLPLASDREDQQVFLASASADTCQVGFICACMPADPASASAVQVPPPCGTCTCASFTAESFEADLTWTSSCRLEVTVHDNVYNCVQPKTLSAGIVTIRPEPCQPICACMIASAPFVDPLALASAAPA